MIDQRDINAIITLVGRLGSDIAMLKCFNQVLLEEVSKQSGSNIGQLYKEIESRHAKIVLKNAKIYDSLIRRAMDSESHLTIEDLLKELGDSV